MMHKFISLNKVQTHIITWGDPFDCEGQDVIICITGNPGITDFYVDFGYKLHKTTGLPLCIVGQAGHEEVPDKHSNILKGQEYLFDLKGQMYHKLDLINNYVDKNSKLHLIGHSIGAWLILELLQENENLAMRLSSINLLFPTLQQMAETRNGVFLNKVIRKLHLLFMLLFYLCYLLPIFILNFLVVLYLKVKHLPLHYKQCILKFLKPSVGEKVLFLAYNEMDTVKKLNTATIDRIKHLTNVIYSDSDNWAPLRYMEDLQVFKPQIQLCEVNIEHAFVLKSSERVADMASNFIKARM